MNDHIINIRKTQNMAAVVAMVFLVIHVGLFLMFRTYGIIPMAVFNIGSILFYALMIPVILKKWMKFFAVAVYVEVVAHMSAAVIFTGWNSGFQISIIGITILVFFSEYIGRILKLPYNRSIRLSLLGAFAYVASFIYLKVHPAPYSLPSEIEFRLQIAWGVIVFSIVIAFLHIFVELAFRGEEFLARRASRDELTGLHNRYYIMDHLKRVQKTEGLDDYYVAMMDIDDFKKINDQYGHNFGDYVLKTLAGILENNQCGAKACRWGGEEFLMVGKAVNNSMSEQCIFLDGLRSTVRECDFTYNGQTIHATITMGVAGYEQGRSIEEWIGIADKKLYVGKYSGKDKLVS